MSPHHSHPHPPPVTYKSEPAGWDGGWLVNLKLELGTVDLPSQTSAGFMLCEFVDFGSGVAKLSDVLEYDVVLLRGSAVTSPSEVEMFLDYSTFDKETTTLSRNVGSRRAGDAAPCPGRTKTCVWEQTVVFWC